MRKIASCLIIILLLVVPVLFVNAEEETKDKINLYVFYGENCDYCKNLHEYLDELSQDEEYNKMYRLVDLEVWNDTDSNNLMASVADYFNLELKGVPFIVAGSNYMTGFNKETSPDQLKELIKTAYEDDDYVDVVSEVDDGTLKKIEEEESDEETDTTQSTQSKRITLILIGIIAIIIVAIIFGRTGEAYLEEETVIVDGEEPKSKEEVTEEKHEEVVINKEKEATEEVKEDAEEVKKEKNEVVKVKNNQNNKKTNTSNKKTSPAKKTNTTKKKTNTKKKSNK